MKKLLSLVLAYVLVFALCACGAAESGGAAASTAVQSGGTEFMIGFNKQNITPEEEVPLAEEPEVEIEEEEIPLSDLPKTGDPFVVMFGVMAALSGSGVVTLLLKKKF